MKKPAFPIAYSETCMHGHRAPRPVNRAGAWVQSLFLILAVLFYILWGQEEEFRTFSIIFSSIVLEAFPFMLLGALIGGLIEVFVPRERIAGILPKRPLLTVFLAAALGLVFPVCECAIVPVVRRLIKKGLPLGAAIAYLLGGPIVNPLVAASTLVAYAMTWQAAFTRLAIGYAIAASAGLLMDMFFTREQAILPENRADHGGCDCRNGCEASGTFLQRLYAGLVHGARDFFDIGRFLIMGAFVAALLQTMVSRDIFASAMGIPLLSILLMMVLAVVLSLCSEADAFVAASFRFSGMPFSAQMGFMVLGPMLDIKLVLMYLSLFRKRAIIALSSLTVLLVFLSMLVMEYCSP
ncbi:MAG: permease [Desulfatibacillum sp.]|nr:permease [Desulfatibacillum sp.]